MSTIRDGRVWCEACKRWLETRDAFQRHKPNCPHKSRLVENRPFQAGRARLSGRGR